MRIRLSRSSIQALVGAERKISVFSFSPFAPAKSDVFCVAHTESTLGNISRKMGRTKDPKTDVPSRSSTPPFNDLKRDVCRNFFLPREQILCLVQFIQFSYIKIQ